MKADTLLTKLNKQYNPKGLVVRRDINGRYYTVTNKFLEQL